MSRATAPLSEEFSGPSYWEDTGKKLKKWLESFCILSGLETLWNPRIGDGEEGREGLSAVTFFRL